MDENEPEYWDGDERRIEQRPETGEAPFEAGEVFYSRTDQRGVIQGGNYVFKRVSAFEWDDLIGAPHKIIRHPDMPKAVFHIMWERILRGEMIGAYVKNKARDGLHYWVFAVVLPWEDGFLSARIKPTSERLEMVKKLYKAARLREENDEFTAEQSAEALLADLAEHGFESYEDFARDSLAEELISEKKVLDQAPDQRVIVSRKLLETSSQLAEHTVHLLRDFAALTSITQNMQIKAYRLEPTGGPVTALSKTYRQMSDEISDWFTKNVVADDSNFAVIASRINDVLLRSCASSILERCAAQLENEQRKLGVSEPKQEYDKILATADTNYGHAKSATVDVGAEAMRISKTCDDMQRNVMGLDTVCVTCKIENARLGEAAGSLDEVVARLEIIPLEIGKRISAIKSCAEEVRSLALSMKWPKPSVYGLNTQTQPELAGRLYG